MGAGSTNNNNKEQTQNDDLKATSFLSIIWAFHLPLDHVLQIRQLLKIDRY